MAQGEKDSVTEAIEVPIQFAEVRLLYFFLILLGAIDDVILGLDILARWISALPLSASSLR